MSPEPSAPVEPLVVVFATRNPGKVQEMRALLTDLPVQIRTLDDYPNVPTLPEVGATAEANATSKAATVARLVGQVALADDSGLEVDLLGGAPGVDSATFLGPTATDEDRNAWVLGRLRGMAEGLRTARFRAVVAVAMPDGEVRTFEGVCEGRIAEAPRGDYGFGYDPIFFVPSYGRTMAELPPEVKNRISHRARALAAVRGYLEALAQAQGGMPPA
jgi:XTP/dITP diphosphohydrolase